MKKNDILKECIERSEKEEKSLKTICNEMHIDYEYLLQGITDNEQTQYEKLYNALFTQKPVDIENSIEYAIKQKLTEVQADVLHLRYIDGLTLQECAKIKGTSRNYIHLVEKAALKKLREPDVYDILYYGIDKHKKHTGDNLYDINTLDLSSRPKHILLNNGITSIEKLEHTSYRQLCNLKGMGKTSIEEIITKLHAKGLSLKKDMKKSAKKVVIYEIDILDLSVRPRNALLRNSITTIKTLTEMTYEQISNLKGMGEMSVKEVVTKLNTKGMTLRQE